MSSSTMKPDPVPAPDTGACSMTALNDEKSRTDLLHRLKRAEGQLRGIQRMIEEGDECLAIASQMSAVRKALDSAYVRMTVCFMEQELGTRLGDKPAARADLGQMMSQMESLLGKIR
jgi:CsoR family transcriptional regulator, copper-sensing transcriptional repressor